MANKTSKFSTFGKILKYIGKYKFLLPLSLILALVSVAFTLYIPILIGDVIDLMVGGRGTVNMSLAVNILIKTAILIGVTAVCQWIMTTINNKISFQVMRDLRNDAFNKIHNLPISYIDSKAHGDIVNRVINDTDRVGEGLLLGFTQVFTGVLTIVGTLFFMLQINWIVALVVVLLTPVSIFVAKFISSRTYNMFKARSTAEAEQTALIDEMVGNQKIVRAFGYEDRAIERFDEANDVLEKVSLKAIFFSSLTNPTTRFVNSIVYAAVALSGALIAIATKGASIPFTAGKFSCLLSYSNQYTKPFNEISGIFAEFQNALASAARVFDFIEADEEHDREGATELGAVEGRVTLDGVHFSYTKEKPLIEDFSLNVKPGMRVAIVGPTGCGKTTVINLLMRFYNVNSGAILVDGKNINDVSAASLRGSYGMVLQDTWLKSGTVKENIAFGYPEATDEQIISSAKSAHAHSFIKRLKNGYDTVIGENGEGLSQGQKQLICIARVMLSLPPMLILDEATSSIDTRTELKIQDAFTEMMKGRTSFIVAHRLSTIREADVIIVMRDGHIIETGTHEELIAAKGFYYNLYESQFSK